VWIDGVVRRVMLWVRPLFSDGDLRAVAALFCRRRCCCLFLRGSTPPSHVSTLVGGKVPIDFGLVRYPDRAESDGTLAIDGRSNV